MKNIIVLAMLILVFGFACGKSSSVFKADVKSPNVVKSIDDLPKPTLSLEDMEERKAVIVIGESAPGQTQYNALSAAKGVAQKNLVTAINGIKVNANTLISKGQLSEETIKLVTSGHVKALDCGAFYDVSNQVGYYCIQLPLE